MTSATDNRKTELLPCPWCGVDIKLHAINYPWADGEPGWNIWHDDMDKARKKKCPMVMGCYDTREEAIAAWNTRAATTIGKMQVEIEPVSRGTLTTEQVREAIEANSWAETSTIREFNDSSWQAIADELNAELGSGTCEVECFDDGTDEGMDGEWFSYAPPTWYLSCGHTAQGEKPNFCHVCGKAVE